MTLQSELDAVSAEFKASKPSGLRRGPVTLATGVGVVMLILTACSDLDIGNWPGEPDPLNPANRPSTMNPVLQGRMFEPGRIGYAYGDYVR